MNIIDQIKEDKAALEATIAKMIREFEDKHQVIEVTEAKVGRYHTGANFRNNEQSYCRLSITIQGIS